MGVKPDFGGIATMYNQRCKDGLTIRKGAFRDCDGEQVPLLWNHNHESIDHVLGHAVLHDKGDYVYADCYLNDTEDGKKARAVMKNRDITSLSIYANELDKRGSSVMHGYIREVSLVLQGANPGAKIDRISIAHAYGIDIDNDPALLDTIDEAVIFHGIEENINYMDDEEDPESTLKHSNEKKEDKKVAKKSEETSEKSVADIFDEMTEEQQEAVAQIVGQAIIDATEGDDEDYDDDEYDEEDDDDVEHGYYGGDGMKFNAFEGEEMYHGVPFISESEKSQILQDAKKFGTLKESLMHHLEDEDGILVHAYPHNEDGSDQTYGIADINWLFPEARTLQDTPEFIKREMDWVTKFINATKHVPFSRVKTVFADITEDEARAKGYTKGKKKIEEVFTLLKRKTEPTTIYKKQKLDRDDIIDITDFGVVAWLQGEMRMMLNEEIARAALVGDGRLSSSDDKINEQNIRPIYTDDELFSIHKTINVSSNTDSQARAKQIIKEIKRARKDYKGSGNPTYYTTEEELAEMLLIEDGDGYFMFKTVNELATTLRVSAIETVPVMEGLKRTVDSDELSLVGIMVNPVDYVIGADKGGEINSFEDFDIDYNQYKYMMETRCSGALVKPKSAIVFETKTISG